MFLRPLLRCHNHASGRAVVLSVHNIWPWHRLCSTATQPEQQQQQQQQEKQTRSKLAHSHRRVENEFFYGLLAQNKAYNVGKSQSSSELMASASNEHAGCVFDFLSDTSETLANVDSKLINALVTTIPRLSPLFVQEILVHMGLYKDDDSEKKASLQILKLRQAVERYYIGLLAELSVPTQMVIADLFYRHLGGLQSRYMSTMLSQQSQNIHDLQSTEFIEHLFFSNVQRSLAPNTTKEATNLVIKFLPGLNIDEVALICQALYKCYYRVVNPLALDGILDVFEASAGRQKLHDFHITALAKYLRFSEKRASVMKHRIQRFLDVQRSCPEKWSLVALTRLAQVGTQVAICDDTVMRDALVKLMDELDSCRIKDISGLLFALSYYNMPLTPIQVERVIERLLAYPDELDLFPRHVVKTVTALALMGYYDSRLLALALDKEKIKRVPVSLCSFDVLALWHASRIEAPEVHACATITPHQLEERRRAFLRDISQSRQQELFTIEIHSIITKRLGLRACIEQLIPIGTQKDIKVVGDDVVVVCHVASNYYNQNRLLGWTAARMRLLRASGYQVIEVPQELSTSHRSITKRTERLRALLAPYLH